MNENQKLTLPIAALITERSNRFGVNRSELARRAGYTNIAKGIRRLDELCRGEFQTTQALLHALPAALKVPANVVEQCIEDTKRQIREAEEATYRAWFVPHAIILTDRKKPQPIFVAALLGVDRLLRINFNFSADPATFVAQALNGVQERLAEWGGVLPAFGRPTGLIVNYTPVRAVVFDLAAKPLAELDAAYRPGTASLSISGRALADHDLGVLFGGR